MNYCTQGGSFMAVSIRLQIKTMYNDFSPKEQAIRRLHLKKTPVKSLIVY